VEQPWDEAVEAAEAPEVSISSVSRCSIWYKLSYRKKQEKYRLSQFSLHENFSVMTYEGSVYCTGNSIINHFYIVTRLREFLA
jgi:hypothetical protein